MTIADFLVVFSGQFQFVEKGAIIMQIRLLILSVVIILGLSNNALAQDKPNSNESKQEFHFKGRFGLTLTKYCLEDDIAPAIALGFGTKNGSFVFGLSGRDISTFNLGIEQNFFDEYAFVGFGLVFGRTFNYQDTGQNHNFARPVGIFGVKVFRKFYMSSRVGLTGGYKDLSLGIQLE